ncbi:hypothetical protein CGLO_11851 [Colletotrichum gloeosporioides Cg-14]|uniref:Uncharacterized protein n=1 Tax=Colletotrichum gloeosporioides (strain Cg-14) TaxID=1237896 RepID=T0LKV0_COLGC|nr:hypothetical protein CGLO_11851 [Colletotrichum gloeosporioides Cg-14]
MSAGEALVMTEDTGNPTTHHGENLHKPWIGYRVEYRNRLTNNLVAERVQKKDPNSGFDAKDGPIFEIVTCYKVVAQEMDANKDQAQLALSSQSLPTYAVRINSIALINAIQSVVRYYPGQDLSGEYITIPKPYPILVHHYDELQEFRRACLSKPLSGLCIRQRDAAEHLRVLLDHLDTEVMVNVKEEQERNSRGYSTFEWRWVAYKPGTTVLQKDERDPSWYAYVVHSLEGGVLENPPSPWIVRSWRLDYDGRLINRVWNGLRMWPKYDGERKEERDFSMTKFIDPTVDRSCLQNEAARELIENGKRFLSMLTPNCYQHHGKTAKVPSIQVEGLAMVDMKAYHVVKPDEIPSAMGDEDIKHWTKCIAEFTRRPLMILTSSDIGTEPREVEANLTENFKRAMNWGAVLLIDEADVFMERRTTSDLTRNSLVAGFLRALEFYDGILFLTTNRVGSFDDAFISRIHIQLYYPDFSDEERQRVWKTFIDKLARERGETIRLTIDAKEYIESMRKQGLKWNGREIRNAFQTAVALAEFEADKDAEGRIKVKDEHLKAVVELSKDFKNYLNDLHLKDEGKRAEQRHERLDSYEGPK